MLFRNERRKWRRTTSCRDIPLLWSVPSGVQSRTAAPALGADGPGLSVRNLCVVPTPHRTWAHSARTAAARRRRPGASASRRRLGWDDTADGLARVWARRRMMGAGCRRSRVGGGTPPLRLAAPAPARLAIAKACSGRAERGRRPRAMLDPAQLPCEVCRCASSTPRAWCGRTCTIACRRCIGGIFRRCWR
jgi:hypothetical protein